MGGSDVRSQGPHTSITKELLGLYGFPMLESAKIGNDVQFSDPTFGLQIPNLADDFVRRANETNLLVYYLFVGQLGQRFQRPAGVEAIALGAKFRFLRFVLQ